MIMNRCVDPELTKVDDKRLTIKPVNSSCFPARDVLSIIEDNSSLAISCLFMGLYGVDSPLPFYLNSICLVDNKLGKSFCDFLDIFNHRSYALYFMAWREFQPQISRSYKELVNINTGDSNKINFVNLLKKILPDIQIKFYEHQIKWTPVQNVLTMGAEIELGQNSMLGDFACDATANLLIDIGNISWDEVYKLKNENLYKDVCEKIRKIFVAGYSFEIRALVVPSGCLQLGNNDLILGYRSWLGEWQGGSYEFTLPIRELTSGYRKTF